MTEAGGGILRRDHVNSPTYLLLKCLLGPCCLAPEAGFDLTEGQINRG